MARLGSGTARGESERLRGLAALMVLMVLVVLVVVRGLTVLNGGGSSEPSHAEPAWTVRRKLSGIGMTRGLFMSMVTIQ